MKNLSILWLLIFSLSFTFNYAEEAHSAKSPRMEGEAFNEGGVNWQKVIIEKPSFQVSALFPGHLLLRKDLAMSKSGPTRESKEGDSFFVVDTRSIINPPVDYEAFVDYYTKRRGDFNYKGQFLPLECQKPFVKYAAEYKFKNKKGRDELSHFFVTQNRIYTLTSTGNNPALSSAFFDSFTILKDEPKDD